MSNGSTLFFRQPIMPGKDGFQDFRRNRKPVPSRKPVCAGNHFGLEPDHPPGRQPCRNPRSGRKVDCLVSEFQAFRAFRNPSEKPLEALRIVDIAMQDLGYIALIEDASFRCENIENEFRPVLDPSGVLFPLGLMQCQPFEIDPGSRIACLALQRLCRNADMGCRLDVDAAFGVGPAIDTDFETGHCQVMVLEIEPSLPLFEEFRLLAGPKFVLDFPGFGSNRISIRANHRDLLGTEPVLGERTQCRHQMDMRIAGIVMEDPIGHLPASEHLL